MVGERETFNLFDKAGFSNTKDTKKTSEFRSRANGRYIYLDKVLLLSNRLRVLVEDWLPNSNVSGTHDVGVKFNSNLAQFPTRTHTGQTPCHYGRAVEADNVAALSDFLLWFSKLS
jgi:hypothetical protein